MSTSNVSYSISNGVMNIFIDGESYVVGKDHPKYSEIWDTLRDENYPAIGDLVDRSKVISVWGNNVIVVNNGTIFYKDNQVMDESLVTRMLGMIAQGEDYSPMAKFIDNLMQNPDAKVIPQIYRFLQKNLLPITKDGYFLSYKLVSGKFTDLFSNSIDNSVGMTVKEDRALVDPDPKVTCSKGLHVCSFEYISSHFGIPSDGAAANHSGNKLIICKVNPRDVVAVPTDYNDSKMRCCEYFVYSDITGEVDPAAIFDNKIVWEAKPESLEVNENDDENDDYDYEDDCDYDYEEDDDCEEEDEGYIEKDGIDEVSQVLRTGQVVLRDSKGRFTKKN